MLTYLLIVFVIALALAPLAHFLPSKRQREIARMREYAAVHGLFVEFRDMPTAAGVPVAARGVIYYGKRLPNTRANPIESACWVRAGDGWRSVGRRLPVPAPVQELSGGNHRGQRRSIELWCVLDGVYRGGGGGANNAHSGALVRGPDPVTVGIFS